MRIPLIMILFIRSSLEITQKY